VQKRITLIMVLLIGLFAAACDGNDNGSPEGGDDAADAMPTATLVPPTDTLVPTSTPITPTITNTPSITYTPTDTPEPTNTPTITLTPTPQTLGTVITQTNANVREGDGVDFEVVASLSPNETVLVLSFNEDETWAEVALPDDQTGWIAVNLLRLEEGTPPPPTEAPTVTPEPPEVTATPTATSTRRIIGEPTPATTERPTVPPGASEVYVLANCEEFNRGRQTVQQGSVVYIHWGWVADTDTQLQNHINHVNYEVTLNDRAIGDWRSAETRDLVEGGNPAHYWYIYMGQLPAGTYRIDYHVTWDAPITDGEKNYGPGTENEEQSFGCTFVVQ
jgi:hypothetical protein